MFSIKTIIKRECAKDRKISIAIMSPFFVLMAQFFVLYYFNIINTNMGQMVQLLSKATVGLFFIYSFLTVFKRNGLIFIFIYCCFATIFLLNFLFFQQNAPYLKATLFSFFFMCLPCFVYSFSINNLLVFKSIMKKTGTIVFFIGAITAFLAITNRISLGPYSMSLSYYMLLPVIVHMNNFFVKRSIESSLITTIAVFIIFALGSRGAILCIGIYVILCFMTQSGKNSVKNWVFKLSAFFTLFFSVFFLKEIFTFLNNILIKYNIHSRTIALFLRDKVHLSGREVIYSTIVDQIKTHPLMGIGLAGDRLYTGGTYSHNIFLEIISGFGIIAGTIILLILGYITIRSLFLKNKAIANLMLMWFCIGFVALIVSGSYLTSFQFWIFLGLASQFIIRHKEVKIVSHEHL